MLQPRICISRVAILLLFFSLVLCEPIRRRNLQQSDNTVQAAEVSPPDLQEHQRHELGSSEYVEAKIETKYNDILAQIKEREETNFGVKVRAPKAQLLPRASTTKSTTTSTKITTPSPIQTGEVGNCVGWRYISSTDTCANLITRFASIGLTLANLVKWNPALGTTSNCKVTPKYYVCVQIGAATTTKSTTKSTTTKSTTKSASTTKSTTKSVISTTKSTTKSVTTAKPSTTSSVVHTTTKSSSSGIATPTPIQAGQTSNCVGWRYTQSTDTCANLLTRFASIGLTLANLVKWNPALGSTSKCTITPKYYVCVQLASVSSVTTAKTSSVSKTSITTPKTTTTTSHAASTTSKVVTTTSKPVTTTSKGTTTTHPPISPTISSIEQCPTFWPFSANDIYQNTTNSQLQYTWMGQANAQGVITEFDGIMVASPQDYVGTAGGYWGNVISFDIRDPNVLKAQWQNGTEVSWSMDGVMSGSNYESCDTVYQYPIPSYTSSSKRSISIDSTHNVADLEKRTDFFPAGEVQITINLKTMCGDPARGMAPTVECIDTTPVDSPYFLQTKTAYLQENPSVPGQYTGTCPFPYRVDTMNTSGCKTLKPAIEYLCDTINDKFLNRPDLQLKESCQSAMYYFLQKSPQAAAPWALCYNALSALSAYCNAQEFLQEIANGAWLSPDGSDLNLWDTFWCHPAPDYTSMQMLGNYFDMQIKGTSGLIYAGTSDINLGKQTSNASHDVTVSYTQPGPLIPYTCGSCSQVSSTMGYRKLFTNYTTVYSGSLILRSDWNCELRTPVGTWAPQQAYQTYEEADAGCRHDADSLEFITYIIEFDEYQLPDPPQTKHQYYTCQIWNCAIGPDDFTQTEEDPNGSVTTAQAWTRDILKVTC